MGGAFVDGMLKGEIFLASDITVSNPTEKKLERFALKGASVTTDNKGSHRCRHRERLRKTLATRRCH